MSCALDRSSTRNRELRPARTAESTVSIGKRGSVRLFAAAILLAVGTLLLFTSQESAFAQSGAPIVRVIDMDTNVDIVSARYLKRTINNANNDDIELIIITLDTPGGTLDSTRDMVELILGSRVPVVVFVSPEGAQAASAGTFLAAASGLLAMAPATNIGAAAVVDGSGNDLPDTLANKVTQDTAAFIRSIAEERGRNSRALEETVLLAKAYSATEAVDLGIADLIARNVDDLLTQIDGRSIQAFDGDVIVNTTGARIELREMSFIDNVISILANPNIAFLLISLGTVALIVELWNPGLWIPGSLGVTMLVLGYVGVGNLDFSWAGVILLALAVVLFVLEGQNPGFSYFGAAGAVTLALGGIFLVGRFSDPDLAGGVQTVSLWLVSVTGAVTLGFVLWLAWQVRIGARIKEYVSDSTSSGFVGEEVSVTSDLDPEGEVHMAGEYWTARLADPADPSVSEGERVRVVAVNGLHLVVEPIASKAPGSPNPGDSTDGSTDEGGVSASM